MPSGTSPEEISVEHEYWAATAATIFLRSGSSESAWIALGSKQPLLQWATGILAERLLRAQEGRG